MPGLEQLVGSAQRVHHRGVWVLERGCGWSTLGRASLVIVFVICNELPPSIHMIELYSSKVAGG